ncbi:hypothetical protein BGZ63DRAFT_428192 [Mariannaea sp. PMI_226]|nr:hypothetical protein BGZ63DRAFT_428192 [Mariannaea sp. PMI_226]
MRDVLPWMVAHTLCVLTHFAFMVASTFAFASPTSSGPLTWDPDQWEFDGRKTSLSWMASATASFAAFTNLAYASSLWKLEQRTADSTSDNRRFNKQVALALGIALNCCFILADFAFAKAAGQYAEESTAFSVVRAFAAIAGVTAVVTVLLDILKFYDTCKQDRETYEVLDSMEPEDW